MKNIITIIVLLMLVSLGSSAEENQRKVLQFGIFGAYGWSSHNVSFTSLDGIPNCCPSFKEGKGSGFSFGANMKIPIHDKFLFDFRLGHFNKSGLLRAVETEMISVDYKPYLGEYEHTIDTDINTIGIWTGLTFNLLSSLNFSIGSVFDIVYSDSFDQQEKIINPIDKGTFFNTGTSVRNKTNGSIPNINRLATSIYLNLSYELPMNSDGSLKMIPELSYMHAISNTVVKAPWTINNTSLGISLNYVILNNSQALPELIEQDITPKEGEIIAEHKIIPLSPQLKFVENNNAVESEVDLIKIIETRKTELQPLLNYVFFEQNSNSIPDRYIKLDTNDTKSFAVNNLSMDNSLKNYYQILNIIGFRLLEYPNAILNLKGYNSGVGPEKDNLLLSKNRAESIKDYLVNNWKIDENRIRREAGNLPKNYSNNDDITGIEENARVEISSNYPEIVAPLEISEVTQSITPTNMDIVPTVNNMEMLAEWKLQILVNDNLIMEKTGQDKIEPYYHIELSTLENMDPMNLDSVTALFKAYNKSSQKWEESKKVIAIHNTTQVSRKEVVNQRNRIDKYSLILFPFNSTKISQYNSFLIDLIKENIADNSIIEVKGYTDKSGDEKYNLELSKQRAENVFKKLNNNNATYTGIGESSLLYDNSYPEGRFYCRTVEIIIYTPIDE